LAADAVLPSLDAGNARLYRRINRPHPQASFARLVQGLIAFRGEYRGRLWLQVMLIKGLNDDPASLEEIAGWVAQIRPDAVHLTLPTRPPAESWVAPSDEAGLARARAILGERAWIAPASGGDFELGGCQDAVEAVIAIITRHPMRDDELLAALERLAPGQAAQALLALQASGRAQVVERFGARFWCADVAYFDQQAAT
jgi:wyosine [tRNA(Phe)-imidazoG37] synthetase (radical SAM superfamily)